MTALPEMPIADVVTRTDYIERSASLASGEEVTFGEGFEQPHYEQHFRQRTVSATLRNYHLNNVHLDTGAMTLIKDGFKLKETHYLVPPEYYDRACVIEDHIIKLDRGINYIMARAFNNYYHWMVQTIPAIDWSLRNLPTASFALLSGRLAKWQAETLAILGYDRVIRIALHPENHYFVPDLDYSEFQNGSTAFEISLSAQSTYRRLAASAADSSRAESDIIYLARTDTTNRLVENEEEIIKLVKSEGIRAVVPGSLSVEAQIKLFGKADAVIGPHGAGMTNIVFCRPGSVFYEMAATHYINPCFARLAQSADLKYTIDLFNSGADDSGGDVHSRNWTIDPDVVLRRIREIKAHVASLRPGPVFVSAMDYLAGKGMSPTSSAPVTNEMEVEPAPKPSRLQSWLSRVFEAAGPIALPAALQGAVGGLSTSVANLVPAFGSAIAEGAEIEWRRPRLVAGAAAVRGTAAVEEARRVQCAQDATSEALAASCPPVTKRYLLGCPEHRVSGTNTARTEATTMDPTTAITNPAHLGQLMLAFESLGDNCEFGLIQRQAGVEPLGLLRFAGIFLPIEVRLDKLVAALARGFDGLGARDTLTVYLDGQAGRREFLVRESAYDLMYHTGIHEGEIEADELRDRETTRLAFLRRKLLDDLQTGEKIWVWKSRTTSDRHQIQPLLDVLRRLGPNTLLWAVEANDTHRPGTVERLDVDLIKGYVERFAPYDNATDVRPATWFQVCQGAFELYRPSRPRPEPEIMTAVAPQGSLSTGPHRIGSDLLYALIKRNWSPGNLVAWSGVYSVQHGNPHARSHEVTCVGGTTFPRCLDCGENLRFTLVRGAESVEQNEHFVQRNPALTAADLGK